MEFEHPKLHEERPGNRWNRTEDRQVYNETSSGLSVTEIAQIHGRTESAIRARQVRLGLREDHSGPLIRPLPEYREVTRRRSPGDVSIFDKYVAQPPNRNADDVVQLLWQAIRSDIDTMCASLPEAKNPERCAMILEERLTPGNDNKQRCTLQELGARFGITRERIRQLEERDLRRLKHPSRFIEGAFRRQLLTFISEIGEKNYRRQGAWLIGVLSHRPCEQLFVDYVVDAFLREALLPKEKHTEFRKALNDTIRHKKKGATTDE